MLASCLFELLASSPVPTPKPRLRGAAVNPFLAAESASPRDLEERLRPGVRILQIVIGALSFGVASFAVVAIVLRLLDPQPGGDTGVLSLVAYALAPVALVLSRVVPAVVIKGSRRQLIAGTYAQPTGGLADLGERGALFMIYQTSQLIGGALLEGAAFLCITAFMLEGNWPALVLAVGLLLVLLTMMPRTERVAEWIEAQHRLLHEEKLLGGR